MSEITTQGLRKLAIAWKTETGIGVSATEVAYLVRQIHIGYGCLNACRHCFAAAPMTLDQMELEAFVQLAQEFGTVAYRTGEIFPFLFLGAASDPSMIVGFAEYADAWIRALPSWQLVRFYTHGWQLDYRDQRKEFDSFRKVLRTHAKRIGAMALSLDVFSIPAQTDWDAYLRNIAQNLKGLLEVLSKTVIKFDITYPVSYLDAAREFTISYWITASQSSSSFLAREEVQSLLDQAILEPDLSCAILTSGVFTIGKMAGLSDRDIILMSRDAGPPFPAGRATSLFAARSRKDRKRALAWQEGHGLYALRSFRYGYKGIVLMPDGRARLVDYLGYRLGRWLQGGDRVISYARSFRRKDTPWRK